jgi:hypothetical protein
MKPFAIALSSILIVHAATAQSKVRTMQNIPGLPIEPLRQMVSPKFFKSLQLSPVEAWITVRGYIATYEFAGTRVTHSELGGKYDALALEMVKRIGLSPGGAQLGSNITRMAARFDVLVYKIKDGRMAIGFAQSDEPGGSQLYYYGQAYMVVEKDGKWTEAKSAYLR